jgi:bifunctional enzyme CysN/CysC
MSERPIEDRARVLVKHTTHTVAARIDEIISVVDIATLGDKPSPGKMELNDLGVVRFRLAEPLAVDPYAQNRATGAFVLVDEATNETVGAGMVVEASE